MNIFLKFFFIPLFFFCSSCYAIEYFYRADERPPTELKRKKYPGPGIYSRGIDEAYDTNGRRPPNISLFNHVSGEPTGNTRFDDGYVSTTTTLNGAHHFGQMYLGGVRTYGNPPENSPW